MNPRHFDSLRSDNSTGYKGICYIEKFNTYEIYIYHKGKKIYLGVEKDIEKAIQLRKEAEKNIWGKNGQ
jgi:hypothetical protein